MKKIISLVLIMLLSLNLISATFASSSDGELEKNINVKYVDGVYLPGSRANMKAKMTKEIGVYELKDGKLIIDTGMEVYLPVDRVEINLVNLEQVEKVFEMYDIPEEVKIDILNRRERVLKNKNEDVIVSFVLAKQPKVRGSVTNYYTYNGHRAKDIIVTYYNVDTIGMEIKSGKYSSEFAENAVQFSLVGAGFASGSIPYIAAGVSLLQIFTEKTGVITFDKDLDDYIEMSLIYDVSNKYTYLDINTGHDYQLGLISQYVYVNNIHTKQFYMVDYVGETVHSDKGPFPGVASKHYFNPAPEAFKHLGYRLDERHTSELADEIYEW